MVLRHVSAQYRLYMAASISGGGRIRKPPGRFTDPREATGKISHSSTLAESLTRTHAEVSESVIMGHFNGPC